MSYPSQPSYTPPYGQPQTPRQNNLWLVCGAIIAVLLVVLTVILFIVQRTAGDDTAAGSGGESTTPTEEAATSEEGDPEPTEEEATPDGGGTGEAAGFDEATCDAYDLTKFEEVIGASVDPDETYTSASSSGETGSVNCQFYTDDLFWHLTIDVNVGSDPDYNIEYIQDDIEYWSDSEGYEVEEYDYGDAGYMYKYGDPTYQKLNINVAVSNIEIEVSTWIDNTTHDYDAAVEMLHASLEEAHGYFAEYEM
ncbi:hypothetical protein [Glycomyces tarimensis]